jgi:hypothetical protein
MTKKLPLGLLTLIVGILGTVYFPVAQFKGWPPFGHSAKLQLEDASIEDGPGKFPVLDITVSNTGSQTAVLKRAGLTVGRVWKLSPPQQVAFSALQPSANYETMLTIRDNYSTTTPISHSLQPNEADRFTILLKHDGSGRDDYVVRLTVTLIYAEETSLTIPDLLYVAQRPGFQGRYPSASNEAKDVALNIRDLAGKKSEGLRQLITMILNGG